jgi:hypothetical protein
MEENANRAWRVGFDAGVTGIFTDYSSRLARVMAVVGREGLSTVEAPMMLPEIARL